MKNKELLDVILDKEKSGFLLYGEGGLGKSTLLNHLSKTLLSIPNTIPIYVDVKSIAFDNGKPLITYILNTFCGSGLNDNSFDELINKKTDLFNNYSIYFLIDGLNERFDKISLIKDVHLLSKINNAKVIVSSRIDESKNFDLFSDYTKLKIMPLDDKRISFALKNHFGTENNLELAKINQSLLDIIRIPLFLVTFFNTYNKDNILPGIYEKNTIRKSEILQAYIDKIITDQKEKFESEEIRIIDFTIRYFIPSLAFNMVKRNSFTIDENEFKLFRNNIQYFDDLLCGDDNELVSIFKENNLNMLAFCKKICALLVGDRDIRFVHQIWRDFFCAYHITNVLKSNDYSELEELLSDDIKCFVGELLGEYKYENKIDLTNPNDMSPIEELMQANYESLSPVMVNNLISIMKLCRKNQIVARYDNLDLSKTTFVDCNISNSSFIGSTISESCFRKNGHTGYIYDAFVSNDLKYIISSGFDGKILFWDCKTHECIGEPLTGHDNWVTSICQLNDDIIVSAGADNSVRLWSISERKELYAFREHTKVVRCVSCSKDGKYFYSVGYDGLLCAWEYSTSRLMFKLQAHNGRANSVTFSNDKKHIITTGDDGYARVWDCMNGKLVSEFSEHQCQVKYALSIPNSNLIASSDQNGFIKIWDTDDKKVYFEIDASNQSIESLAITENGNFLISAGYDQKIRIYDTNNFKPYGFPLIGHKDWINSVTVKDDIIISSGGDQKIMVWDINTLMPIEPELKGNISWIKSIGLYGNNTLISAGDNKKVLFWDLKAQRKMETELYNHTERINTLKISNDKSFIVTGSDDNTFVVWRKSGNGFKSTKVKGHNSWVRSVAITHDDKYIITGSWDNTIKVWDSSTLKQVDNTIYGHTASVEALETDKKDEFLYSASDDGTIKKWDLNSFDECKGYDLRHDDCIRSLRLAKNDKLLISAGWDAIIKLWNTDDMASHCNYVSIHNSRVDAMNLSADENYLIAGSDDRSVCIIRLSDQEIIFGPYICHNNTVSDVLFLDDNCFISCSLDGSIIVFDHKNKKILVKLIPLNLNMQKALFSSNVFDKSDTKNFSEILIQNGAKFLF